LDAIPLGALPFLLIVGVTVAPVQRPRPAAVASWLVAMGPNELPGILLVVTIASQAAPDLMGGDLGSPRALTSLAVAAITSLGLALIAVRGLRTPRALRAALDRGLPRGWRDHIDQPPRRSGRPLRSLLWPWPIRPRRVERTSDIAYGPRGEANRLDVYRHRSRPEGCPTLIHLHGGHFRWGAKSREARVLLHRLADHGWTCISADYRRSRTPGEGFAYHLLDAKRAIAWARTDGRDHGVDPDSIVVAGSSAGAHLATMVGLTADDGLLQRGVEGADTSVAACVGLYGYYGRLGGPLDERSSPLDHLRPDAPPMLLLHGTNDTCVPVTGARALAEGLRAVSRRPVVLAELPGGQHNFDLFASPRFEAAVDAIEAFCSWALRQRARQHGAT
jgi:acetyl esterase/lipase